MASNWTLGLLLIFILATCIHEGISIKCWDCNSAVDPKCGDPFDNTTLPLVNCYHLPQLEHLPGVKSTMCRKIRQRVNGEIRIHRHCAYLSAESNIVEDGKLGLITTTSPNRISTEQPTTVSSNCISTEQPTTASSNRISLEYFTCDNKDGCNGF